MVRAILLFYAFLIQSCLFSNDDEGKTINIDSNFSILIYSSGNQVMYKEDKEMKGYLVMLKDVDSIGWGGQSIIVKKDLLYFVFKKNAKGEVFKKYTNYEELSKTKINDNILLRGIDDLLNDTHP